jgi:glycosyltransferase involved in cell wall biosynthesis
MRCLKPVRVCFLIDELAAAGTETQLLALIRHLDRRRVEPILCLLHGDGAASRALEPADCPVHRLGVGALLRPDSFVRLLRFAAFLRRERIDVLQAYFPDSSYFGIPAAWLAGVPHRLRTRNNLGHWLTPLHRLLGRALNALTTLTVANCQAARQALLTHEAPHPDTVVVLENGVDLDRFLDLPLPLQRRPGMPACVGAVANLRAVKGLDVLIDAAQLVACPAEFAVAGEGEERGPLEEKIAAAGLHERFRLPGASSDVPGFLSGLDVAVLCSRAEGMPNAVLEYMAAARPIVASAVGAVPELIEDGVHGLLVPPGDARALAEAIARLLSDPLLAARLGEAARRRAIERHGRAAMVRRFEDFYEQLARLSERGRPARFYTPMRARRPRSDKERARRPRSDKERASGPPAAAHSRLAIK